MYHPQTCTLPQKVIYAKADSLAWQIQSSGRAETSSIAADTQGNVFVGGSFSDTIAFEGHVFAAKGEMNGFIAKYDASGAWQWTRQSEGSAVNLIGRLAVSIDGSVYATGTFKGKVRFGNTTLEARNQGAFLVKYDAGGTPLWAVQIGQGYHDLGWNMTLDREGNAYVAGHWGSADSRQPFSPYGATTAFLAKYDEKGVLQWLRRPQGGSSYGQSVAVDGEGNAYLAGMFMDTLLVGSERLISRIDPRSILGLMTDGFVIKYDQEGNYRWAQRMGGKGPDGFSDVATDAAGNVYVAGMFSNSEATFGTTPLISEDQMPNAPVNMDNFIAKLDADGQIQWIVNKVQTEGSGRSLVIDTNGYVYVAGNFSWQSKVAGQLVATNGGDDLVLVKLTNNGKVAWVKTAGGPGHEQVSCIALGPNGEILLTGTFQGTTTLAGRTFTASGERSAFVVKYPAK